jgi:hypothetical protein
MAGALCRPAESLYLKGLLKMNLGSTEAQSALASHSDNLLQLRKNMDVHVDVMTNVTAIHSGPILNIVESGPEVSVDVAPEGAVDAVAPCADGVCSIGWKPKRPRAA